ncbi:hypothetical protein FACS1894102_2250 [Spirochaetia bacterium]|nr:hypothetical protein FACS1894102_2250 [Spirochaetia bacterium]
MANNNQLQQEFSHQIEQYVGPLPPSNEFENYEKTLNGSADRILTMAEEEAEYRHKADTNLFKSISP